MLFYLAGLIGALALHLDKVQRQEVLREALEAARSIASEFFRADSLAALVPHLDKAQRQEVLREALEAARSIGDYGAAWALAALAPHLATLPFDRLQLLWTETLHGLARNRRGELCSDLAALSPILPVLGGPEGVQGLARAIVDVGRWWP